MDPELEALEQAEEAVLKVDGHWEAWKATLWQNALNAVQAECAKRDLPSVDWLDEADDEEECGDDCSERFKMAVAPLLDASPGAKPWVREMYRVAEGHEAKGYERFEVLKGRIMAATEARFVDDIDCSEPNSADEDAVESEDDSYTPSSDGEDESFASEEEEEEEGSNDMDE
jgi:hypothetical protein